MKRLRKFALDLDRDDWPNDYGYAFYLRSRALCTFVERRLRGHAVPFGSTKLVIRGKRTDTVTLRVNSSGVACVTAPFPEASYEQALSDIDSFAVMKRFVEASIARLEQYQQQALRPILNMCDEFWNGQCINEWVHVRKSFIGGRLAAELKCAVTQSEFSLTLEVELDGRRIYATPLLVTEPDELAYYSEFEDLVLEDDRLVITTRRGGTLLEVPLDTLLSQH